MFNPKRAIRFLEQVPVPRGRTNPPLGLLRSADRFIKTTLSWKCWRASAQCSLTRTSEPKVLQIYWRGIASASTGAIEPRVPYPPAIVFSSGFIRPCLPTKVAGPPSGPLWVHEIKQDGYRLMLRRDGARVRCFTRNGCDCTDHFPAIVDAALRIRATSFMIDGEAVIARADGSSDFYALRSRRRG